jgi:hypothetical protein
MPSLPVILRDILFLRRGPQDLPYSLLLLVVAGLASMAVSYWATSLVLPDQSDLLPSVVAGVLLHLGFLYLLLNALQRQARFVQTALAKLLVDVLFTAVVLPLLPMIEPLRHGNPTPESVTAGAAFASLLFIAFGIWRIVVDAHVMRQALEIRLLPALLINIALVFASQIVLVALFGSVEGN